MADKMNWKIVQIQDIAQVIRGASPRPKGDKRYYGGNVPRLMVEDVTRDGKYVYPSVDFLTEEGAKLSRPCKAGTLTIVCSGTVGVPSILGVDACIHDGFLGLIKVSSTVSTDYLYHFFCTQRDKFNNSATHGGVFTNLTTDGVKAFEVSLPIHLEEQEKIATALSDTDALISELEKLIEKKQAIKTATMQQLLTGKTRLPEFALREDGTPKAYKDSELGQIPEDWGVYPLKSLLKSQPKYGINAAATQLSGDLPTYIRITDIDENGKFNPSEKVGVDSPLSGNYILEQGDIVLARTGASVGKSYLYDKDDGELVYAGFLIKISPAPNLLCSKYLSIYLQTKEYWDWIATNSMRSGQPGINGNQYASLKIVLPSFNEQLKISRIFKDIDRDLEQLKIKLDKVTLLKQGMMQELLTGKTRLV